MRPDMYNSGASLLNPQSWNAYSYVLSNPLSRVDRRGRRDYEGGDRGGGGEGGGCLDASCENPPGDGDGLFSRGSLFGLSFGQIVADDGDGQGCPAPGVFRRAMLPLMLLAHCLLLLTAAATTSVQDITAALQAHRFEVALQLAKAALQGDPENPALLTLEGLAEAGQGQEEQALIAYRRAAFLRPDYLPALQAEAEIEFRRKEPRCRETLQRVLQVRPSNPVAHAMLGSLAYERHDCASVVSEYVQSEPVIQAQSPALTQYGECLLQQGKHQQAIAALTTVTKLTADQWEPFYNLAVANLADGRPAESLLALQTILREQQPPFQVLDLASAAYEQMGETPRAVASLRSAIVSAPETVGLYLHFADLCFAHQSFAIGIEMIQSGLQRMPNAAPLYLARGILQVQMGQYAQAESDFEKASVLDPAQSFSSVALGLTQLQESNLDEALRVTEDKLRQNASDAYLNYLLAEILRQRGAAVNTPEFGKAMAAVKRAVNLQPEFPLALDLLGDFYLRSGQLTMATAQFEKVLALDPTNQSALYHSIIAFRRSGNVQAVPELMRRLADAKTAQRKADERTNRYVFVHPHGSQ